MKNKLKPKVYIIGGSGFIGSNLSNKLFEFQANFSIGDLLLSKMFPEKTNLIDIRNKVDLVNNLNGDVVINLAAVHRDDVIDQQEYFSTNVLGAQQLCKTCEEKGINKIIFTSSVAVYGFAEPGTGEDGLINPFNEYGRTKALAENV